MAGRERGRELFGAAEFDGGDAIVPEQPGEEGSEELRPEVAPVRGDELVRLGDDDGLHSGSSRLGPRRRNAGEAGPRALDLGGEGAGESAEIGVAPEVGDADAPADAEPAQVKRDG